MEFRKRGATNNTFVGIFLIFDNVISSYTLFINTFSGVNSMPVFFQDHCCILYSIIGWNCSIGMWSRVEGSRCDPNPNEEFSRPDGESLFGNDGKLTPSITILGEICFIRYMYTLVTRKSFCLYRRGTVV